MLGAVPDRLRADSSCKLAMLTTRIATSGAATRTAAIAAMAMMNMRLLLSG
jgi:hypothetical protein